MQTITVKNIQEKQTKDGSKSFFIITDTTGASFSLWEPIGMIKPGCVLDADIEVKGKYANIKNFKITSQPESTAPDQNGGVKPAWIDNAKSIEAQVAIKEIGECWRAGKFKDDDILVSAYRAWITGRLAPPAPKPASTPNTSQPVAQKQAPASVPPAKIDDDLFDEKNLLEEALKCDTGGKLGYFAQQHGIDLKAFVAKVSCAPSQLKTIEQVQAAARVLFGK